MCRLCPQGLRACEGGRFLRDIWSHSPSASWKTETYRKRLWHGQPGRQPIYCDAAVKTLPRPNDQRLHKNIPYKVTLGCVHVTIIAVEKQHVLHIINMCVCVFLVTQHAMRMLRMSCCTVFFLIISQKARFSVRGGELIEYSKYVC